MGLCIRLPIWISRIDRRRILLDAGLHMSSVEDGEIVRNAIYGICI